MTTLRSVCLLFGWLLLGCAFLVVNHYPPWVSVYNEALAALALGLLALAFLPALIRTRQPAAAWFLPALAVIPCAQWVLGLIPFSGDALIGAFYLFVGGSSIAVGAAMRSATDGSDVTIELAAAVLITSLVSCAVATLQVWRPGDFGLWVVGVAEGARAGGNVGQPNNLATLIGIGGASLLLLRERGRLSATASVACVAVLIGGAALTQSRTALAFGPIVFGVMLAARRQGVSFGTSLLAVAVVTACHWALTLAWPAIQDALLLGRPESLLNRGLATPRWRMWEQLLDALALRPWSGYGWLHVGAAQLASADGRPPTGELWLHAHNLFLDLLLWAGFPIGMLLCSTIGYWYVTRLRRLSNVQVAVGMMIVCMFGLHAMLELPHYYLYFLVPIGIWIGVVEHDAGRRRIDRRGWFLMVPVAAMTMGIAIAKDYPAVEEDFRLVRFENLRIGDLKASRPAPEAPFLSSLTGFLRFARVSPAEAMTETELDGMRLVVERYPYAPSLARYASALALNGRLPDATATFIKIRRMFGVPTYLRLRKELGDRVTEGQSGLQALLDSLPER